MDDDADKSLNYNELKKGLHDYGVIGLEEHEIRKVFDDIDKDHSGTVSFDEFLKALRVSTAVYFEFKLEKRWTMKLGGGILESPCLSQWPSVRLKTVGKIVQSYNCFPFTPFWWVNDVPSDFRVKR